MALLERKVRIVMAKVQTKPETIVAAAVMKGRGQNTFAVIGLIEASLKQYGFRAEAALFHRTVFADGWLDSHGSYEDCLEAFKRIQLTTEKAE